MIKINKVFFILIAVALVFTQCSKNSVDNTDFGNREHIIHTNQPPTIKELSVDTDYINFDETVNIVCSATDPEGDSLIFYWHSYHLTDESTLGNYKVLLDSLNGELSAANNSAQWKPPVCNGKYIIICMIKDMAGYQEHAAQIITVSGEKDLQKKLGEYVEVPDGPIDTKIFLSMSNNENKEKDLWLWCYSEKTFGNMGYKIDHYFSIKGNVFDLNFLRIREGWGGMQVPGPAMEIILLGSIPFDHYVFAITLHGQMIFAQLLNFEDRYELRIQPNNYISVIDSVLYKNI